MADWHWEPVTDDLLDGLPPAALAAVRQVAEELTVRESMIFLDGREFTGEPPGLRTVQRGPLMLVYLTDVRGERVVITDVFDCAPLIIVRDAEEVRALYNRWLHRDAACVALPTRATASRFTA